MSILVITTGGTIGALAYENLRQPPPMVTMPAPGVDLVRSRLRDPDFSFIATRCLSFEPRDSKQIDDPYRERLLDQIADAPETAILVTHGTDRILETALTFYRQRRQKGALANKIIILTGSMIPLANGPLADGFLNLKYALEQLQQMSAGAVEQQQSRAGVYIVLCDYEKPETESGAWMPRLYPYQPDTYEKVYASDGRYNRLRQA